VRLRGAAPRCGADVRRRGPDIGDHLTFRRATITESVRINSSQLRFVIQTGTMAGSPSVRKGVVDVEQTTFQHYDTIECLLAESVVGHHRYARTMLVYRNVSKGLRDAVDRSVERWCCEFSTLQTQLVTNVSAYVRMRDSEVNETIFKTIVSLEKLAKSAFGSCAGSMRSIIHISKMDDVVYYGAATRRCVLCGGVISDTFTIEDAEDPRHVPVYTFAHTACQRKHMVNLHHAHHTVAPRGEQPDLHRELHALLKMMHGTAKVITRDNILPRMSEWYHVSGNANPESVGIRDALLVWLKPHNRVKPEDTICGALGINKNTVLEAIKQHDENSNRIRDLALARRLSVQKRTAELTSAYEAELRVWLGKGKTRWRSLEDLMCVHPCIMSSSLIDRLIDPFSKRGVKISVATVCNSLHIFSHTIDHMVGGMASSTMDWVVRCATVNAIFGDLGYEMQYIDNGSINVAVDNEARAHAKTLELVQSINSESIVSVKAVGSLSPPAYPQPWCEHETKHSFKATILIADNIEIRSYFCMSHSEMGKFKYAVAADIPGDATLPSIPTASDKTDIAYSRRIEGFIHSILKECFSDRAGMARALGLELILSVDMFHSLVNSVSSDLYAADSGDSGDSGDFVELDC
jgi:hypothetical protein